ncbi:hypothetical protein GVO57_05210 [Sphingomonas changnyeongensis]|uniref:Uncharacterized protein n=1 Tax=Sphingomonas changnyeongensis TaxID=2698679 RepID=A0A7Z2S4R3_9SPHN|nr:hypothetical protein [Sphingomonas changnyeongensis]QHL90345.1 hypothetical protein GVO57_05210 [Sphingomonas changnyeongensis]
MILFLLAQAFAAAPLPPQMEPALDSYAQCLNERFEAAMNQKPNRRAKMAAVFEVARAGCAEVRAQSIERAMTALAELPAFSDPDTRSAFVQQKFDGLEQLLAEVMSGGMDPGKWK